MAFWSESGLEPKRAYRFRVQIAEMGAGGTDGGYMWYAKKVGKPTLSVTEHAHKYLNHTFYYPGKVEWTEITLSIVDPVEPDMGATVADLLTQSGYVGPTQASDDSDFQTVSKSKSVTSLGNVVIEQIDSDGGVVEKWTLNNAWIKEIKWGELDYEGEDLTTIDVTLRYDWATLSDVGQSAAGGGETKYWSTQ